MKTVSGQTVTGAVLMLWGLQKDAAEGMIIGRQDEHGSCDLGFVDAGDYILRCEVCPPLVSPRIVNIPGGGTLDLEVLVADRQDSDIIAGVVVDDLGKPIAGAKVARISGGSHTDLLVPAASPDGHFRCFRTCEEPPYDSVRLVVWAEGYRRWEGDATYGQTDLRIVLDK